MCSARCQHYLKLVPHEYFKNVTLLNVYPKLKNVFPNVIQTIQETNNYTFLTLFNTCRTCRVIRLQRKNVQTLHSNFDNMVNPL